MAETDRLAPLTWGALAQIVDGLSGVSRVVEGPEQLDGTPRSLRLIATETYDVWLITWPPGSTIDEHDHGEALGVMRVVSGALVEVAGTGKVLLAPGRSVITRPGEWHMLTNPTHADATTVHAYSPPLETITYRRGLVGRAAHPAGGDSMPRKARATSRPAEATTYGELRRSQIDGVASDHVATWICEAQAKAAPSLLPAATQSPRVAAGSPPP